MNINLANKITYQVIKDTMKSNNYILFSDDKAYNLNIIGIRANIEQSNSFDDIIYLRYRDKYGSIIERKIEATTDPGLDYLKNPLNKEGCAILKAGQYRGAFRLGKHQGQYDALVQNSVLNLIRDFNLDSFLSFNNKDIKYDKESTVRGVDFSGNKRTDFYTTILYNNDKPVYKEEATAYAGINLHRSSSTGGLTKVGKYSAGCQVINDIKEYNNLIDAAKTASTIFGNSFTYTLLEEWNLILK